MPIRSEVDTAQALGRRRTRRARTRGAVGIFETDAHGAPTFASPAWRELSGTAESTSPDRWFTAIHPDDVSAVVRAWESAVAAKQPLDVHYRSAAGGQVRFLRTLLEPVPDAAGSIARYAGVTIDVSPQTEHVAQVMPQLVWLAAADGTITFFNRMWLDYTGVGVDELSNAGPPGMVHPEDVATAWERWKKSLAAGVNYEAEYRLRRAADGAYRWFLGRATPVRNDEGRITHWVGTATDIDAQKRAYANLRFVLETGAALAASYDVGTICSDVAQLAVNRVSDWCFVVLSDENRRSYQTAAVAHRDAQRLELLRELRDRHPAPHIAPLEAAIRKNVPLLISEVTREDLRAGVRDPEQLADIESLEMRSAMILPLSDGMGNTYGALILGSSQLGHTFSHDDLEVAEMVAQRAGLAIHTARAFDAERRRANELRVIARAGEIIFEMFDLQEMLDRLASFIVGEVADLAYVMLLEHDSELRTVSGAHRDPAMRSIAERLVGQRTLRPQPEESAIQMLAHHRPSVYASIPIGAVLGNMWEYLAADVRALDIRTAITIPLYSRGETFGALAVYRCGDSAVPYDDRDLPLFQDVCRRLSIALDHARTLARERRISEALQQALLPPRSALPREPGIHLLAEYRPSSSEADVGGDWYDAMRLPDGSIAVSIGDVTGRGLDAAGLMGNLRQSVAMAAMYETDPARILDAVDYRLRTSDDVALATAFIGIIDPQHRTIRYASAGHPPPMLRRGGDLIQLTSDGLPLGLRNAAREETRTASLEGGQLLALYTDGLIEATRDVAFGMRRLEQLMSSQAILYVHDAARFLCDACLPTNAQDDTAVLTISFGERAHWAFDAENAQAAHDARTQFRAHLEGRAAAGSDLDAAELIFGELIGNVVRHAPGPIDVQVEWTGECPVLHVTDRGKGFIRNPALPIDPLSESGRGLYIISLLARSVVVERVPGYGNHVAAALNVPLAGAPL